MSDTSRKILGVLSTKIKLYVNEWGFPHLIAVDLARVELTDGNRKLFRIFRHPTEEERNNV